MILICGFLKCVLVAGLTKCIPDAHMGFPMNPGCFRWLWSVGVNKWTHYLLKSCMTFYYNDWHLDIENKSYNYSVTFNYLFKNFVAISPPPCIYCFLITSSNIKQHANLGGYCQKMYSSLVIVANFFEMYFVTLTNMKICLELLMPFLMHFSHVHLVIKEPCWNMLHHGVYHLSNTGRQI